MKVLCIVLGGLLTAQDPQEDIRKLKEKIVELEKRIQELEKFQKELEEKIGQAAGGMVSAQRAANERNAAASLKVLSIAQADFRSNDRDGNRINDFWVGDVRGLYSLVADAESIRLIEQPIAAADANPGKSSPPLKNVKKPAAKAGYYFVALRNYQKSGEGLVLSAYDAAETGRNATKFGFAAYPAEYGKTGWSTFIISEENVMYKNDTGGKPPEYFPADPGAEGWGRID